MKKLSISLVVLSMTSLSFGQNSSSKLDHALLDDFSTRDSNHEYLNEVQNNMTPNQVKYLEKVVSYWDLTQLEKFREQKDQPLQVTFKSPQGSIVTSYDMDGEILTSKERFRDFALPYTVSASIVKKYPNWSIGKSRYSLLYTKADEPKKRFRVQITKGDQKKWIEVDQSGSVI